MARRAPPGALRAPAVRTFGAKPKPALASNFPPPVRTGADVVVVAASTHALIDAASKLSALQDVCFKLLASGRHVTMSTQHVDDHLLDDLRHELIRQGVMVKREA